jgi:hypothetical protein
MGSRTKFTSRNLVFTGFCVALFLMGLAITGFLGVALVNTEDANAAGEISASAVSLEHYATFGGTNYDDGFAITTDGTYLYVVGATKETGDYDVILIKCDPSGNQLWNKTWGGPGVETPSAVALDSAGNIYITGMTMSYGVGIYDMFILKYTSGGVRDWNYTWGYAAKTAFGNGLLIQYPQYIYVVGSTNEPGNSDIMVVKYDGTGAELWNSTWGGSGSEHGYAIGMDTSAKLYLVGSTESYGAGGRDLVIVKMSSSSPSVEDYETWGGTEDDFGNSLKIVANQLYIAGGTESYGAGGADVAVLKYDQSLNQQWAKTYGGSTTNESASAITHYNGSLLIAGTEDLTDVILVQYLTNGDYVSSTSWGTAGDEWGYGITVLPSGSIFVVSTTDGLADPLSDIVLLEFSATYPSSVGGGIPAFGVEFLVIGLLLSMALIVLVRKNQRYLQAK